MRRDGGWGVGCAALLAIALAGCGPGRSAGLVAGDPTGVTYLHLTKRDSGVAAALGIDRLDGDAIEGHADWIAHTDGLRRGRTSLYLGGGLTARRTDDPAGAETDFGVRAPVGLTYVLYDAKVNMFAEIAPTYWFDAGEAELAFGVGMRFR